MFLEREHSLHHSHEMTEKVGERHSSKGGPVAPIYVEYYMLSFQVCLSVTLTGDPGQFQ